MLAIDAPIERSAPAPAAPELPLELAPQLPPELPPQRLRSLARAARHEILRRLAPPLRHDMVVHLQSLGMMAEALSARLERGTISSDDLQGVVSKLNRLARQAVSTCVDVSTWMQPAEDDTVNLPQGVSECVRLLSTSLNFRGFELHTELGAGEFEVSHSAVRFLLSGAILVLTDTVTAPGSLTLRTELASTHGIVTIDYAPQPEASFTQPHEPGEAPLAWGELQALAVEESAELRRAGSSVELRLPRAVVTTPLKMAPV